MLAHSFLMESSSKLLVTRTGIKARTSSILGIWFPWPIYMFFLNEIWPWHIGLRWAIVALWATCSTSRTFLTSDSMKVYRQWVPCERNSSYNFFPIFFKLCLCFLHGLKMCIWFGYNPCINFCHFSHFVIFWPQILWKFIDNGYLVSATPHTILYQSFLNFASVFSMVWRCTCGLDIILALIFVTFSTLWTLSFSDLRFYESL